MAINIELAERAEERAKEMSLELWATAAMWEACLTDAYDEIRKEDKPQQD